MLSLSRPWDQPLVRELRSCKSLGVGHSAGVPKLINMQETYVSDVKSVQILMISHVESKKMIQMNFFTKQK